MRTKPPKEGSGAKSVADESYGLEFLKGDHYMTRFKIIDRDGNEVNKGDMITDHRGEPWIFQIVTRGPMPGKSAKVHVTYGNASREFYAEVFGLTVTVTDAE